MSSEIRWYGDRVEEKVLRAAVNALTLTGEVLLTESNRTVPWEEGTLERSGSVDVDKGEMVAAVSYDTPYARMQHEETSFSHRSGRRAKWLKDTLEEQKDRLLSFLRDELKKGFR